MKNLHEKARDMDVLSSKSKQTGSLSTKTKNCTHGYQNKANCKKCSPHLVCKHNLFKRRCVACTGGCEHGKKRYACMKCNPNLSCVHGVWKYACPTCNPPKPKNTDEFKRFSSFMEAKVIRVKACCKDQFTYSVKVVKNAETLKAKQDIESAWSTPHDEHSLSFCSFQTQSEFAKALWTYVHTE